MNPELIEQAVRDYGALRRPGADPGLEAVRTAILFEDLFDVALSDDEIDPDPSVMAALAARLREGA